jgi:flagellar protein FlgJ
MGIETLGAYQIDNTRYDMERLRQLGAGLGNQADGNTSFSDLLMNQPVAGLEVAGTYGASPDGASPYGAAAEGGIRGASIDRESKLYDTCRELETYFLKILISGMRKTVEKSELSQTGFAGEMYEDMLYDEYTKDFARNSGFGFADLAYLDLTGQRGKVINHAM